MGQTNYATPTPGLTNDVRSQFIGEVVSSFVAFNPSEKYVFVNLDHFHQRLQKNDTQFFSRHKWIKNLSEKSLNTVGSFDPIPSLVPFGAERIDTTDEAFCKQYCISIKKTNDKTSQISTSQYLITVTLNSTISISSN